MRRQGLVAVLTLLGCLFALLLMLSAADNDKSSSDKRKDSGSEEEAAEDSQKESLPLLAIPPAPVDEAVKDDAAKADGVTASSKKHPVKGKDKAKNAKSGTISSKTAGKNDKVRDQSAGEQKAAADQDGGEAVDVMVSSNVKSVARKPAERSGSKTKQVGGTAENPASGVRPAAAKSGLKPVHNTNKPAGTSSRGVKAAARPKTKTPTKSPVSAKSGAKGNTATKSSSSAKNIYSGKPGSKQNTKADKNPAASGVVGSEKTKNQELAGYFDDELEAAAAAFDEPVTDLDDAAAYQGGAQSTPLPKTGLDSPSIGSISTQRGKNQESAASSDLIASEDSGPRTLAQLMNEESRSSTGSAVPQVSYIRTIGVLALLVGCMLLLGRGLKHLQITGRLGKIMPGLGGGPNSMKVVESISLGPGKQIMIVELHGELLVLGSTAQNINLLDKLPGSSSGVGYRSTVSQIIQRELGQDVGAQSMPTQAAQAQASSDSGARPLVVNGSFKPRQMTVAEMRASRGSLSIAEHPLVEPAPAPRWSRAGEAGESQLISRIREQLKELEEA